MDGDHDAEGGERRDDKPRGVSKARLADLDLKETISIWHKSHKGAPNVELVSNFPKAAATLFCNKVFEHFKKDERKDDKMYKVFGGEKAAYDSIFTWIKDCVDQQSVLKYPDIPEPEKDPLKPTLDIIVAGSILDVPAGSLGFFLEKRLNFIARKHLMPFEQVEKFYTTDSEPYKAGLKKIACASIFNAWFEYRLDESVTPELMEDLSDLRDKFPELDQDLHDAVAEKDAAIEKSRLEKKLKREAEQNGTGADSGFGGGWDQPTDGASGAPDSAGFGSGWDTSTPDASGSMDWMNDGAGQENGLEDWSKPTAMALENQWEDSSPTAVGGDWADEVNEEASQPHPISMPSSVW